MAASLGFGPPRLADSDVARMSLTPQQIVLMRSAPVPELTAAAALLVNPTTGQVLYAHNEHARRAPGSLTKLITALVALERAELDRPITVIEEDLAVWTMIGLNEEEVLPLGEILPVLLVPSDNAAAMAIARNLGGSVATFVGWMNDWVAQWGMENTHLANPSGLDAEGNYTSAWDMARITLYAMQDPLLRDIVGRHEMVAANRRLVNTNEMLTRYPGAVGVKTGTETQAGECLITLVERRQGDALSVILGSSDRYADATALLDYFYTNYAELTVTLPPSPINRYVDANGELHEFGLREPLTFLVRSWQIGAVTMIRRIENPAAAPGSDEPVGRLQVFLAGRPLVEAPLYAW
jgi:serine-type D-Ala-D-Ala carboxypeptidase (penicillin-binding protein 5/6)